MPFRAPILMVFIDSLVRSIIDLSIGLLSGGDRPRQRRLARRLPEGVQHLRVPHLHGQAVHARRRRAQCRVHGGTAPAACRHPVAHQDNHRSSKARRLVYGFING